MGPESSISRQTVVEVPESVGLKGESAERRGDGCGGARGVQQQKAGWEKRRLERGCEAGDQKDGGHGGTRTTKRQEHFKKKGERVVNRLLKAIKRPSDRRSENSRCISDVEITGDFSEGPFGGKIHAKV